MNLVLKRTKKDLTGIYGDLYTEDGKFIAKTLEHAYLADGGVVPKVPHGDFRCVRGNHQLHSGLKFETFMVTGVPNHQGILFHVGNYNRDSEGCILLGLVDIPDGIGKSGDAFRQFMELQKDRQEFFLKVEG